jgi:hypothetical protein
MRTSSKSPRAARRAPALAAAMITCASIAALTASCGSETGTSSSTTTQTEPPLTAEELKDPQKCQKCHPDHYREWSGSMHAYAAVDPVFLAMNARGQRETNGALGDFCVKCHAPIAVMEGATKDGLNLADLGPEKKGITCYFCHSVKEVSGTHNNPLVLADDGVLRAGIADPVETSAHKSAYSTLHDRTTADSSTLCGSCHDVVTPAGAHIERTFAEWKDTLFAHPKTQLSCGQCHMEGRDGLAADAPGVKVRRVHGHGVPGVDVALTDFPEIEAQKAAIQQSLDTTLLAEVCVRGAGAPGATIQVVLDNAGAGHMWPSGASQDRRAWVELIAYAGDQVVYQSGVVPDGKSVSEIADPDLWWARECMLDQQGKQVHMFWEAADFDQNTLPGPTTNNMADPAFYATHVVRTFPRATSQPPALATPPDRVTMRVLMVPVGLDVLDDLVASSDLDPKYKAKMPTFVLGPTNLEWTEKAATIKYPDQGVEVSCVTAGLSTGANNSVPAPEMTKCP